MSVRESARPMTYAPMMSVRPSASKAPAMTRASPNASVAIAPGALKSLRSHEMRRASTTPTAVPTSHTPNAFTAVAPMESHESGAISPVSGFGFCEAMMPMPIASTMMPRTSSMTAPAMIVTPSSESIFFFSERIRAVMPTEVAVDMMPMNIAAGERIAFTSSPCFTSSPSSARHWIPPSMSGRNVVAYTAHRSPKRKENTTPPIPTSEPANAYLRNILRFVSMPERNRSTTDAMVQIP